MALARLYGWDYWQVQALPVDYVEELFCALNAAEGLKGEQAAEAREAQWLQLTRMKHSAMLSKYFRIRG